MVSSVQFQVALGPAAETPSLEVLLQPQNRCLLPVIRMSKRPSQRGRSIMDNLLSQLVDPIEHCQPLSITKLESTQTPEKEVSPSKNQNTMRRSLILLLLHRHPSSLQQPRKRPLFRCQQVTSRDGNKRRWQSLQGFLWRKARRRRPPPTVRHIGKVVPSVPLHPQRCQERRVLRCVPGGGSGGGVVDDGAYQELEEWLGRVSGGA